MKKVKIVDLTDLIWMMYMVTCIFKALTKLYIMWKEAKIREEKWKRNIVTVRESREVYYDCDED